MSNSKIRNSSQFLSLENEKWKVDMNFESGYSEVKEINPVPSDYIIELTKPGKWDSILKLEIHCNSKEKRTCIIRGIDGSNYLHKSDEKDNSQTVKIDGNDLILSLGFTLFSIDLTTLAMNWKIRPDMAEIFQFHDFQNDYLLRGEMGIHRINKQGNVKWSYGGRDIWVNLEGKPEVQIEENVIRLFDFDSNEYLIDFDGNTVEDNPREKQVPAKRKWWQFNR